MVSIKDVARAARVSVATVSRVQNESANVTEPTRRRVRAVAERLGYSPHAAARSLSTSKTGGLGVLLPDLYGEFYSELIRGIDQTAQRHGYHVLLASSHNEKAEIAKAVQSMRGRVDGVIMMSPAPGAYLPVRDLPATFPVVLLNCAAGSAFDSIAVANARGAQDVVRHLVELGHRRIAMITGPARNQDAAERLKGYRAGLREAGIAPDAALEEAGDFSDTSGFRAALDLLTLNPRPTALFAANDAMAIGAVSALRESGVRVPEDVAVAGFDDIPMARYMHPPLTTVRVDIAALGERAATRLLEAVTNRRRHKKRREVVPVTLVIRASSGGPHDASATASPRRRD
ncbi:MAG TPA: LacI family DNA-binding transcriptional regulator [Gemmatimonadales bacterium]|nr:LacI family DNA-binding transcriptional regulator [Gemmatimonadales bacterium]